MLINNLSGGGEKVTINGEPVRDRINLKAQEIFKDIATCPGGVIDSSTVLNDEFYCCTKNKIFKFNRNNRTWTNVVNIPIDASKYQKFEIITDGIDLYYIYISTIGHKYYDCYKISKRGELTYIDLLGINVAYGSDYNEFSGNFAYNGNLYSYHYSYNWRNDDIKQSIFLKNGKEIKGYNFSTVPKFECNKTALYLNKVFSISEHRNGKLNKDIVQVNIFDGSKFTKIDLTSDNINLEKYNRACLFAINNKLYKFSSEDNNIHITEFDGNNFINDRIHIKGNRIQDDSHVAILGKDEEIIYSRVGQNNKLFKKGYRYTGEREA